MIARRSPASRMPRNSPTAASDWMGSQKILKVASSGTAMNAPGSPRKVRRFVGRICVHGPS